MNSRTLKYNALRNKVVKEAQLPDGRWKCEGMFPGCEALTESPIVDHIEKRSSHPELLLERSNLQILCPPCNIVETNKKP